MNRYIYNKSIKQIYKILSTVRIPILTIQSMRFLSEIYVSVVMFNTLSEIAIMWYKFN